MESLDEFISEKPKIFHPVNERGEEAWFPGSEASSLLIQADHIWEDMKCLQNLYHSEKSEYTKKVLLKYVVIELRSLIQIVDRIQAHVMKAPVFDPKERQGWRELTHEEQNISKELFREYSKSKAVAEKKIIQIRNEIGAHRGNINWKDVMGFWDSMTPELINPVLKPIHEAVNYVRTLDLFEWSRITERGTIQVSSAVLRPEYFEEMDET